MSAARCWGSCWEVKGPWALGPGPWVWQHECAVDAQAMGEEGPPSSPDPEAGRTEPLRLGAPSCNSAPVGRILRFDPSPCLGALGPLFGEGSGVQGSAAFFLPHADETEPPPVFPKKPLVWEEDMELYSKFLDRKVRGL